MKERAIKRIFDNILNKAFDVDEIIRSQREGFDVRSLYNKDLDRYSCVECCQNLVVSFSSLDNVYFRHKSSFIYCIYKDENISNELLNAYEDVRLAKESPRHKELKNLIGKLLYDEPNVELDSIDIDTKFLMKGGERRRPDVYCKYDNKEVAFEIQLSPLPLHYIQHRYQFYKKNNIYLIWILDIKGSAVILKSFERDVKYIWKHQNLFILNEHITSRLELNCHYKIPFNDIGSYKEKWYETSINFDKLKFDEVEISCFFYDYLWMKTNVETEILKFKQEEVLRLADVENKQAKQNAAAAISSLREKINRWRNQDYSFYRMVETISNFDVLEIEELNRQIDLNLVKSGVPLFLYYIKEYVWINKDPKTTIVELILCSLNIQFNINTKDISGHGVIQYLYLNKNLSIHLYKILPLVFLRKYKISAFDEVFIKENSSEVDFLRLHYFSFCEDDLEIEFVKGKFRFLQFIESAIQMNMLESNQRSWVKYMMPIISNNKDLWIYIKDVFEKTRLGDELKRVDKKGTVSRKVIEFDLENIDQNIEAYQFLVKVYPEIFL
ncbi:DUF6035 family protein [Sphingobacterium sp. UDSM-2020]|uniref:DUF6035 family protein n=1 Tax=Sphingobacterium sp. UDSM-2020 TaxID=2795738 RepID=UPI001934CDE7|nr:DUF6035 family protein [Sphingobacterium sp. UDSM-2020]QQD12339.1 hypothetical protein JAZ75_17240 [Sphingobacterium sp. UDSM-2020]